MTLKLHPRTPPEVVAVLSDRERLAELLATRTQDEVCEFVGCGYISLRKATHPETIRQRRAEIQKLGGGGGALLPSPGEAARRRALDGAGPPRGRR